MSRARRRYSAPAVALRKLLHADGLRYRVAYPVPRQRRRTIDIAFTRQQVTAFIDGRFWHNCPEHGAIPRTYAEWWRQKIASDTSRDMETNDMLREHGRPRLGVRTPIESSCED